MLSIFKITHCLSEGGESHPLPRVREAANLCRHARSKRAAIRYGVARNRFTPPEAVEELLHDSSWPVRMALAWRTDLSSLQFETLLHDEEAPVREAAKRNPMFETWFEEPVENNRILVEANIG